MKRKTLYLLIWGLSLLLLPAVGNAQGFIHPGILHTQADFDRIKQQLADGNESVTAGYKKLTDNWLANKWDGQWGPTEYIIRGGTGGQNYMHATRDASMAYLFALRYKITDDAKYADRVIQILNAYPPVTKGIGGDTNASLASGFIGYYFANAAELVRDYEGWARKDFGRFKQWMVDIFFAGAQDFLQRRHGTCNSHYQSNWGECNILTVLSIGVLCDDPSIYNTGMYFLKQGDGNESISLDYCGSGGGLIPFFHADARGPYGYLNQMQESTRDQPHCMAALGMLLCNAEIGWNQGDNIWNSNDNMIAGAIEYVAAWNSLNETTEADELANFPSTGWSGCGAEGWQPSVSWSGRGQMRPIWQIGINHFGNRMGKDMTYAKRAKAILGVEGGAGNYGDASGGFDNAGFGDLMYNEAPYTIPPTVLRPRIVYNGSNNDFAEISKVTKGSTLTLQALLPEGEEATGTWEWDNGETTVARTLTAEASALYRVVYTNTEGAKSTQMFSVAVYGDCISSSVIPSYTYNGITVEDTLISVPKGSTLKLAVAPKAWNYDNAIKWNNGSTSASIELTGISSGRVYKATVTNRNGGVTVVNFHIEITEIASFLHYNGTTSNNSSIQVPEGSEVKLWAVPVASAAGGTFEWSDGSAKDTLFLTHLKESEMVTLVYTSPAGKESKTTWQIDVVSKNTLEVGDYFFQNAAGLYYTNPCANYVTDNSEVMTFEALNEEDQDTQIWTFAMDPTSQRYKVVSKKDGRFLNEHGSIRNRDYYPAWNTYAIHHLTGSDAYAFQNGGDAGADYWVLNDQGGITGKGAATMSGFPFVLVSTDRSSVEQVETSPKLHLWQVPGSDQITLVSPQDGVFYLTSMNGSVVREYACQEGENSFSISDLEAGVYFGVLWPNGGAKSVVKIIKGK